MEKISWSAAEYEDRERSTDWFWWLGLIAIAGAVAAIYFENYLLAILIVIAAGSIALFAVRKPRHISYTVSEEGIFVDDLLYPFGTLDSFWIETRGMFPKMIIASKKFFVPYIVIPILDHEPKSIRVFLLEHLPEVEHHEPLLQIIAERLGL